MNLVEIRRANTNVVLWHPHRKMVLTRLGRSQALVIGTAIEAGLVVIDHPENFHTQKSRRASHCSTTDGSTIRYHVRRQPLSIGSERSGRGRITKAHQALPCLIGRKLGFAVEDIRGAKDIGPPRLEATSLPAAWPGIVPLNTPSPAIASPTVPLSTIGHWHKPGGIDAIPHKHGGNTVRVIAERSHHHVLICRGTIGP